MKAIFVALVTLVMLHAMPTFAAPTAESPLLGHWTLDVATLPMPPEVRPKSVTLDFRDMAGGKLATHAEIIDQNDNKMYAKSTLSLDGTPGRASVPIGLMLSLRRCPLQTYW